MAPFTDDMRIVRPVFSGLRALAEEIEKGADPRSYDGTPVDGYE